jgi:hypothetical protein
MKTIFYFVKYNLIKQVRSYQFLLIIAIGVFLGFLCVPAKTAGYELIYLGGVRGMYNSAWLGAMGALLPAILFWLPGFYLLRSQISEDKRLKMGNIIASTPISKFSYIMGKALANFMILTTLVLIFLIALIGMQLVRHENMHISLLQFIQPFLLQTVPYLIVLAALTILFDILPGIKRAFGNIVIFGIWIVLLSTSVLAQDSKFDLLGIGTTLVKMVQDAQAYFPEIHSNAGSVGFNTTNGISPTFAWAGMTWNTEFLISRFTWIGIACLIIILSSLLFNRFAETDNLPQKGNAKNDKQRLSLTGIEIQVILSPVIKERLSLLRMAKSELKIMLSSCSIWWGLATLACVALSLFVPLGHAYNYISLIMLLPIAIWSQMGCRENYYFTTELVTSSCPLKYKRGAEWLAGFGVAVLVSSGILVRFAILAEWQHVEAWLIGILFIPTLALLLGCLGGNRKLFEAVYIAWLYFGPINGVPFLDFLGISHINIGFYLIFTCILIALVYLIIISNEKHFLNFISRWSSRT